MSTYDLAQRRRRHVLITVSSTDPASLPEWQKRAVMAWIRDTCLELDTPVSGLGEDWRALLKLAPPSSASRFGLLVLAHASDRDPAADIPSQHGPTLVLWLTCDPQRLLAQSLELARAAAAGRTQHIDLTDEYLEINAATEVVLGDEPFTSWHRLGDVLDEAAGIPQLLSRGSKRDQEIARRLEPVLDQDGSFEAILAMGSHLSLIHI